MVSPNNIIFKAASSSKPDQLAILSGYPSQCIASQGIALRGIFLFLKGSVSTCLIWIAFGKMRDKGFCFKSREGQGASYQNGCPFFSPPRLSF